MTGAASSAGTPGASALSAWSLTEAEDHLRALELFGMRFGLDRMRRLMTALDSPQVRFDSIHVVGTNGKSSTTRMIAAILQRHGLRSGAYLSPHLISYTERIQVAERDVTPSDFAAAVQRAAAATAHVNHTLAADDHVTQFELITAAAFWELLRQGVEVAAIEAGLGGRFDATNVLDARVCVLTNVGLEHTRWLGPTVADIAAEKLAVVGPDATLVVGAGLPEEVMALASAAVGQDPARLVVAEPWASQAPRAPERTGFRQAGGALGAAGAFQRQNFGLAKAAAEHYLAAVGGAVSEPALSAAARDTVVPGRMQTVCERPLTIFDAAHNPDAAVVLAASVAALPVHRPLGLVLGVLDDKDAVGMLRTLLPISARAWFTAPHTPRALSPSALQSLAGQLDFTACTCEPRPEQALAAAWQWAEQSGGIVLACGSVYLVGELLRTVRDREHVTEGHNRADTVSKEIASIPGSTHAG